ncbi:UPAR/Ly6 domain-containing protein crok [Euwallacea similis]|uniref:UPAR/Ly6 domain-containing protein crok n=1 Tax=Euwallacea similis TaxID=1736056 RepID=UPI00344D9813
MTQDIIYLLLLTFLIGFPDSSYGIKCWDCRSDADSKCADPFDNRTFAMTDCDQVKPSTYIYDKDNYKTQKATMCRKIRQKVNGVWKYFRSCAFLGEIGIKGDERFCLMRTGTYNIFMEYCTCNSKDGCNTSSHVYVSNLLLGLSFISICYFLHVFR